MEKLSTIQKRNNLNTVYKTGDVGPGGTHYEYVVSFVDGIPENDEEGVRIQFQCGPRRDSTAPKGVSSMDLLEIVRDQLRTFQAGPLACRENACALTHIEEALMWLNRKEEDRTELSELNVSET